MVGGEHTQENKIENLDSLSHLLGNVRQDIWSLGALASSFKTGILKMSSPWYLWIKGRKTM